MFPAEQVAFLPAPLRRCPGPGRGAQTWGGTHLGRRPPGPGWGGHSGSAAVATVLLSLPTWQLIKLPGGLSLGYLNNEDHQGSRIISNTHRCYISTFNSVGLLEGKMSKPEIGPSWPCQDGKAEAGAAPGTGAPTWPELRPCSQQAIELGPG